MPVVITEHWSGFAYHALKKFEILRAHFSMNRARCILPVSKNLAKVIRS